MSDMTPEQTVEHINNALAAGESKPVDVGQLMGSLGAVLIAAGNIVHLRGHAYVESNEIRPDVEMMIAAIGQVLWQLSEEDE